MRSLLAGMVVAVSVAGAPFVVWAEPAGLPAYPPNPGSAAAMAPAPLPPTVPPLASPRDMHASDRDPWAVRAVVESLESATISAALQDEIIFMPTRLGQEFRKGETLVRFECSMPKARLASAMADKYGAEKRQEAKQKLAALNSAGQLELDQAKADLEKADAAVALAQAEASRCVIPAPFDSRVTDLRSHPHELTREGVPLLEVLNDRNLQVEAVIPSRWLSWLKQGTSFRVALDEVAGTIEVSVVSINGRVDPASQTIRITGALKGDVPGVIAGMSGTATFTPPKTDAVAAASR